MCVCVCVSVSVCVCVHVCVCVICIFSEQILLFAFLFQSGRLFVRNLAYVCTEDALEALFKKYGTSSFAKLCLASFVIVFMGKFCLCSYTDFRA